MKTKVLIATYYWPPAGGIAVQRWLQFSDNLSQLGYEVHVYTAQNASYPIRDESLEKKVNNDIRVVRQNIWEPYQIAEWINPKNAAYKEGKFNSENPSLLSQLSLFIRANFFIPDARTYWVKPSVQFLKEYLNTHQINNLITTGPPHSVHLMGLQLTQINPLLNWIADFRDPWTEISYHKELPLLPWAKKKHKMQEKQVLQSADWVTAASFTDAENYSKLGARVLSITNGFESLITQDRPPNKLFTLSYIGKLESQRNARAFWRACEELAEDSLEFKENLCIQMIGNIADSVKDELNKSPIASKIKWLGIVSYEESKNYMNQSDILLIFNFPENKYKGIIPGKLFDYLAAQQAILSVGPEDADAAQIIEETASGKHFNPQEQEAMKSFIEHCFTNWKKQKKLISSQGLEKYSRKNIAKKLIPILNNEKS